MAKFKAFTSLVAASVVVCGSAWAQFESEGAESIGKNRERAALIDTQTDLLQKEINLERLRIARDQLLQSNQKIENFSMPTVISIQSFDGNWQAKILFESGSVKFVKKGDLLNSSHIVADIGPSGVDVGRMKMVGKNRSIEVIKTTKLSYAPIAGPGTPGAPGAPGPVGAPFEFPSRPPAMPAPMPQGAPIPAR